MANWLANGGAPRGGANVLPLKTARFDWLSKEAGRVAISALMSVTLLVVLALAIPLTYQVGDDVYYRSIVAGYITGEPDAHTVFMGYGISLIMAGLYRTIPAIPWYDITNYFILVLSSTAIIKSLFKVMYRNGCSQSCAAIVGLISLVGLFAYPMAVPNFSTTSAIAGAAAVAVIAELLTINDENKIIIISDGILFLLLSILSFEWRVLMFELSACFIAVVAFCRVVWGNNRVRKTISACLAVLVAALVPLILLDVRAYESSGWDNYISYNSARAHYMDYSHPSWSEATGDYTSEGWTENLIKLVENRFLMDEDINEESFKTLAHERFTFAEGLEFLLNFIKSRPVVQGYMAAGALLIALVVLSWTRQSTSRELSISAPMIGARVSVILIILGTLAAICYCSLRGNLFFRHFVGLMLFPFPAMIGECSALFSKNELAYESQPTNKLVLGVFGRTALIVSLCIPFIFNLLIVTDGTRRAIVWNRQNVYRTVLRYTSSHPNNIYIGSIYPDFSLFKTQGVNLESNYFFWGHFQSMMYSPLYTKKLINLGISEWMYSDVFLNNDVYYVGNNDNLAQLLISYLEEETGLNLEWDTVDVLPSQGVVCGGSQYVEETYNPEDFFRPIEYEEEVISILKIRVIE